MKRIATLIAVAALAAFFAACTGGREEAAPAATPREVAQLTRPSGAGASDADPASSGTSGTTVTGDPSDARSALVVPARSAATPAAALTLAASSTATSRPTFTSSATATASPTASATPTATATPLDPLSVEYMRRQSYPGSAIVIERTLSPGANYKRYLASYRSEGLKIYALLTIPDGENPPSGWPAIIFNHGYIPPAQYRTTERYVAYVDAFARNGYIVFKPDYRGHGSSQGEATGGYGSPAYTIDVLNALASVKQLPDADANRLGMWGHSMGGHLTLRAMVTTDDVKAGVIWAGVVATYPNMMTQWRRPSSAPPLNIPERQRRWRQELTEKYGTPEENPAFWASISPAEFVSDLSGPLQLQHGTADVEVPLAFSKDLEARVRAAGKTIEYFEYPGDDHNISKNLTTALARSVAFFDRYVKAAN